MTFDELKTVNDDIVAEALRDLGLRDAETDKLRRIAKVCETNVAKNDGLKRRLARDRDYQMRCLALDARSAPLREILKIVMEEV